MKLLQVVQEMRTNMYLLENNKLIMRKFKNPKMHIRDERLLNWNTINNQKLIIAFMKIQSPDLMRLFLDDLMTKNELEKCVNRLRAVELLMIGMPYENIRQMTSLSSATIAKISKLLVNKKGGFQEIMLRIHPQGQHYFD